MSNKYYRTNQHIKADQVRVIGSDGSQLGVMTLVKAIELATSESKDVVEVADKANPPVVKIIEFSKFKYQEDKKERAGQAKSTQDTKELLFKPFMAENDVQMRINRAKEFLTGGDKVKLMVKFRGREITKKDFGDAIINKVIESLAECGSLIDSPKMMGKMLIAQLKPKK